MFLEAVGAKQSRIENFFHLRRPRTVKKAVKLYPDKRSILEKYKFLSRESIISLIYSKGHYSSLLVCLEHDSLQLSNRPRDFLY